MLPRHRARQFIPDPAAVVSPAQRVGWFKSDTSVTSSGSRVSNWGNIWGNGDLAQATAGSKPLLVSSAFAGFDGIQSDDGARFMEAAISPNVASGSRVYMWLYARTDVNAASKFYLALTAAAGASPRCRILSSAASNLWATISSDGTTTASQNSTVGLSTTPALVEVGFTFSGAGIIVASGTASNGTALSTSNAAMSVLGLFSQGAGTASAIQATVFEIVVMSGVPDHARKMAMRQYFRKRYGAI